MSCCLQARIQQLHSFASHQLYPFCDSQSTPTITDLMHTAEEQQCNSNGLLVSPTNEDPTDVGAGLKAVVKMVPELCEGPGLPLPSPSPTRPSTSWSLASANSQVLETHQGL